MREELNSEFHLTTFDLKKKGYTQTFNADALPSKTLATKVKGGYIQANTSRSTKMDIGKNGKWCLYFEKGSSNLDKAWDLIKKGIESGELYDCKVTPLNENYNNQTIIVYTHDYDNIEDIADVHTYLERSGIIALSNPALSGHDLDPELGLPYFIDSQTRNNDHARPYLTSSTIKNVNESQLNGNSTAYPRQWDKKETLAQWWDRHEKQHTRLSTPLTKALKNSIESYDETKPGALLSLFEKTNHWLLQKVWSQSSRYTQVIALRNNIYDRLLEDKKSNSYTLDKLFAKQKKETLHRDWKIMSHGASFFQTKATDELDKAFKTHAMRMPSEEADMALLKAMNLWLSGKNQDISKRYTIVATMAKEMEKIIHDIYRSKLNLRENPTQSSIQIDSSLLLERTL